MTDASHNGVELSRWGVVLLAHGSQRGNSRMECSCAWREEAVPAWCQHCPSTPDGLRAAARRIQEELGIRDEQIVLSCLEFIEPHPDEAIRMLDRRGLRQVVVMPFLLGHGKHATLELDEIFDEVRAQLPEVRLYLADGFGPDPGLADLIVERVQDIQDGGPAPGFTGILVVKAGTKSEYDDCLWLEDLGALVEQRLGPGYAVAVAQSHYGEPTMDRAAAQLVERRGVDSITCVPYLFFPGLILRRNVLGGLDQLQGRYPHIPISVTPPLGIDDRVVTVTADRVRRAWSGRG